MVHKPPSNQPRSNGVENADPQGRVERLRLQTNGSLGRSPIPMRETNMGASEPATPDQEPSDEELMQQLAAGQPEALAPLHLRYAALMFGLAARTLGPTSAEEIVQDVFVTI